MLKPSKSPLPYIAIIIATVATTSFAELESKLDSLKQNYERAIARATAPITQTYVAELKKLKEAYLESGRNEDAVEAQRLIDAATGSTEAPLPTTLSEMTEAEFLRWLETVSIVETEGPFLITFSVRDGAVSSQRKDSAEPREHETASISLGSLLVPFTSTNATIQVADDLTAAKVTYSAGGIYLAKVVPRSQ